MRVWPAYVGAGWIVSAKAKAHKGVETSLDTARMRACATS